MDALSCDLDKLPRYLYRVHYPRSQTTYSKLAGLEARDTETVYEDTPAGQNMFRDTVRRHLTWNSRQTTPFISLFSNRDHAVNWGWKESWRCYGPFEKDWSLITISTELLAECGSTVFRLSDLADRWGIEVIPEKARQHVKGEYLCLHRVPAKAILEVAPRDEIRVYASMTPEIERRILARRKESPPAETHLPTRRAWMIEDTDDVDEADLVVRSEESLGYDSVLVDLMRALRT